MPYSELTIAQHLGSLERETVRDADNGWITEDGTRIITFRIGTFQAMMDRLTSLAGSIVTQTLFYQMGNEIGRTAMRYSKDSIRSAGDLTKVLDRVLNQRGWGRCLSLEMASRNGDTPYVCALKGTPTSHQRTTKEATCHLMRGVVAGWLEAYLNRKAKSSIETECASMGKDHCVIEVEFEELTILMDAPEASSTSPSANYSF